MKIRPVGAKLFHADGHQEFSIRFSQICDSASNMELSLDTGANCILVWVIPCRGLYADCIAVNAEHVVYVSCRQVDRKC